MLKRQNWRSKGCDDSECSQQSKAQENTSYLNESELNRRKIFSQENRENKNSVLADINSSYDHDSHYDDDNEEENSNTPSEISSVTLVQVWNVSFEWSWQTIKDPVRQTWNVDLASIASFEDGRSKGCAIVTF